MELCTTSNFNLLEILKLISPWLLACIVYNIWHRQKGKEVISNEAKQYIINIIEFEKNESQIYSALLDNNQSKEKDEELQELYNNYRKTISEMYSSMLFLSYALKSDSHYVHLSNQFLDEVIKSTDRIETYQGFKEKKFIKMNSKKIDDFKEYLYKYVIFKK